MASLDLDLLKKHVRADDFSDDDQYLAHLLDAAKPYVCTATNRNSEALGAAKPGEPPATLQHAL